MKLLRLKLGVDFRSLPKGFEIRFLREGEEGNCFQFHPYCLAGLNGSGKSNVLEAFAAIFYHLECMALDTLPAGFRFDEEAGPGGFQEKVANPDAFEVEYLFPIKGYTSRKQPVNQDVHSVARILIRKAVGQRPEVIWLNRGEFEPNKMTLLTRPEVKGFLPKHIVGYSSGHNEILSLPFIKMRLIHFDEYRARLLEDLDYGGRPEGRMIYLDDQFSQAILLCHFLFPSEAITKVFKDKIGLKGIRRFRIIIRRVNIRRPDSMPIENDPPLKIDRDRGKELTSTVELTSKLAGRYITVRDEKGTEKSEFRPGLIDKLISCSTTHNEDYSSYKEGEGYDLVLDYFLDEATRNAFEYHFRDESGGTKEQKKAASALNLFQSLQTLLTLNYYQVSDKTKNELYLSDSLYLNETIPLPASDERIMRFKDFEIEKVGVNSKLYSKSLSDGEHQLLHTIGLCLLFRHEPVLFLLDEPETHLNPDWRASYISTLRAALEADGATKDVMREVLLTSHSPFIISDCREENVLVFEKKNGKVRWRPAEFRTFGASSNAITIKVFGRNETIGNYALDKLNALSRRLDRNESPDDLIREANAELGDSVEKVLFVNRALDKKEVK